MANTLTYLHLERAYFIVLTTSRRTPSWVAEQVMRMRSESWLTSCET